MSAEKPERISMPKYALANDNWIGRMPWALTPGGQPLSDMERKSLARGRMCVTKVIAEPERRGPKEMKQGGLRGNTIAFPQAKVELLRGQTLPAAAEEAARFLSETVTIALAGVDVDGRRRSTSPRR